jgi:hypothetical protein
MKRVILAGALSLAAAMGLSTSAHAQMVDPGDDFQPQNQPSQEPRDITNQDIVDKAELDAVAKRRAGKKAPKTKGPVPATQADIVAGSEIRDNKGVPIGKVDRLDADGVVVATTGGRVKIPLDAFGKDDKGLVFAISKAEFDQMLAGVSSQPAG